MGHQEKKCIWKVPQCDCEERTKWTEEIMLWKKCTDKIKKGAS